MNHDLSEARRPVGEVLLYFGNQVAMFIAGIKVGAVTEQ